MKRCDCCNAVIADTSLRLICPPCADSLIVAMHTPHLVCREHGRTFEAPDWDNRPVEIPSNI